MKGGRLYTVSYDIAHDGRRVKVANVLKSYGERVQYSVFECRLSAQGYECLKTELLEVIHPRDTVRLYRFSGRLSNSREVLGQRREREVGDPWIV